MSKSKKPKRNREVFIPILGESVSSHRTPVATPLWSGEGLGSGGGSGRAYCRKCGKVFGEEGIRYGAFHPTDPCDHYCLGCIKKAGRRFFEFDDINGVQTTFGDYSGYRD